MLTRRRLLTSKCSTLKPGPQVKSVTDWILSRWNFLDLFPLESKVIPKFGMKRLKRIFLGQDFLNLSPLVHLYLKYFPNLSEYWINKNIFRAKFPWSLCTCPLSCQTMLPVGQSGFSIALFTKLDSLFQFQWCIFVKLVRLIVCVWWNFLCVRLLAAIGSTGWLFFPEEHIFWILEQHLTRFTTKKEILWWF